MALPATDNFNRADSSGLGANWTAIVNNWNVVSNTARPANAGAHDAVYWSADAFANDQECQIVCGTITGVTDGGPGVRVSGTGGLNGYFVEVYDSGWILTKFVTGSQSSLTSGSDVFTAGDACKIAVVGTAITVYRNGVSIGASSDASLASGACGLWAFGLGTIVDDFVGNNAGAPPTGGFRNFYPAFDGSSFYGASIL